MKEKAVDLALLATRKLDFLITKHLETSILAVSADISDSQNLLWSSHQDLISVLSYSHPSRCFGSKHAGMKSHVHSLTVRHFQF